MNSEHFSGIGDSGPCAKDPQAAEALDIYLDTLWKQVSRTFFQSYGESEKEFRRSIILSAVLESLMWRMSDESSASTLVFPEDSLFCDLVSLGSDTPHSAGEIRQFTRFDETVRKSMVMAGRGITPPEGFSILTTDQILLIQSLYRKMKAEKNRERKKNVQDEPDFDLLSFASSPVFHHSFSRITGAMESGFVLFDPVCGTGEVILYLARYLCRHTENLQSRITRIASGIICAGHSPSSVLLIRFGLVLLICGDDFSEPSLTEPTPGDEISRIMNNVRVGSMIFRSDISEYYLSEDEQKRAVRRYAPLPDTWPDIPAGRQVIVVSAPWGALDLESSEVRHYLCSHYGSFSQKPSFSTIAAERIVSAYSYPAYIFIRRSWLSDGEAEPFRRWIRAQKIAEIGIDDDPDGLFGDSWTCLVTGAQDPDLLISRIDRQGTVSSFVMKRSDLPDEGGWPLEDPASLFILEIMRKNAVPLFEYCLGALYHPDDFSTSWSEDPWISIIPENGEITIGSGNTPDPDAAILLKGPDPYLEALLTSSLLRYYCHHTAGFCDLQKSAALIPLLPVKQPDYYNDEERHLLDAVTTCMSTRSFLIKRMECAHSYHDTMRITRQLKQVETERDTLVCKLYDIPEEFHHRFF